MYRDVYNDLVAWKKHDGRKPLILEGARQVGKTYVLKDFGKNEFEAYHYVNFEENQIVKSIFEKDYDPLRIINELSLHFDASIDIRKDLIIFDEIQECPSAITSLKYFAEKYHDSFIVSAGSLLGVSLTTGSFPVGKVSFLKMYPMGFYEFLKAIGNKQLVSLYDDFFKSKNLSEVAHNKFWDIYKSYLAVGGMPAVINAYRANLDNLKIALDNARKVQLDLLRSYQGDFSKHSGKVNSMHINTVFENVATQLSLIQDQSVKRYQFKDVISGKKGFGDLEGPISWLLRAGLVLRMNICNRSELPLKSFVKTNLFKLYYFDVGLLAAILRLPMESILRQDYGITKGYIAENFVAQEFLLSGELELNSWNERNSEIEFLRVFDNEIVPVEVKSSHRTKAKSLQTYIQKYAPKKAVVLSASSYAVLGNGVEKIPIYFAGRLFRVL